jgi:hypothetical protein
MKKIILTKYFSFSFVLYLTKILIFTFIKKINLFKSLLKVKGQKDNKLTELLIAMFLGNC